MALCWTLDKLGPMCRSADDCGLVLDAVAGPDPEDETTIDWPYRYAPEAQRREGFRLAVPQGATESAQPEVAANFTAALAVLRQFATIEEIALPEAPYDAVAITIIRAEAASAFDDLLLGGRAGELTAPEDRVNPLAYSALPARDYLRALRIRHRIQREMDAILARFDAIVAPGTRTVAGPITESFSRSLRRAAGDGLGAAGNLAGLPAMCVPSGFGERGLPTSIQFVGRAGAENVVLAVANAYQQRTDWHRRIPPGVV
jgi:aspartyl-tRNA(Asn)/glutamyl-tRNA(Gln) amidotransferase subunit A